MIFETVGDRSKPVIVMLNGAFSTSAGLKDIAEMISDDFYTILPIYNGHYEDGGVFDTREEQAEKIIEYLNEQHIDHIAMVHGISLGAEIALTLAQALSKTDIQVDQYLFDGGPFYHLSRLARWIMRGKCRLIVHAAQGSSVEDFTQYLLNDKLIQWLIRGEIEPYIPFIAGIVDAADNISDESINNESDAIFDFHCHEAREEDQKKYMFMWSEDELPSRTAKKIKRNYPHANYWTPGALGHCGFIFRKPSEYAEYIGNIARENYCAESIQEAV